MEAVSPCSSSFAEREYRIMATVGHLALRAARTGWQAATQMLWLRAFEVRM